MEKVDVVKKNNMKKSIKKSKSVAKEIANYREEIEKRMNAGEEDIEKVPALIKIKSGEVLNPYFIYMLERKEDRPIEMLLDEISEIFGLKREYYWNEWCYFWVDQFNEVEPAPEETIEDIDPIDEVN